jgi:hypothetical protein
MISHSSSHLPYCSAISLEFRASRISPRPKAKLSVGHLFVVDPCDGFAVRFGCSSPVIEGEDVLGFWFVCECIARVRGSEVQSHYNSSFCTILPSIHDDQPQTPPPKNKTIEIYLPMLFVRDLCSFGEEGCFSFFKPPVTSHLNKLQNTTQEYTTTTHHKMDQTTQHAQLVVSLQNASNNTT